MYLAQIYATVSNDENKDTKGKKVTLFATLDRTMENYVKELNRITSRSLRAVEYIR